VKCLYLYLQILRFRQRNLLFNQVRKATLRSKPMPQRTNRTTTTVVPDAILRLGADNPERTVSFIASQRSN
jgi:hypothetical protein